jgi:hypothetical protein
LNEYGFGVGSIADKVFHLFFPSATGEKSPMSVTWIITNKYGVILHKGARTKIARDEDSWCELAESFLEGEKEISRVDAFSVLRGKKSCR